VEPNRTDHPDLDTLALYALYRLAEQNERVVEQHVFQCASCQRAVRRLARQAQLFRAAYSLSCQKANEHE
jgi:anti-sigma factor RsiW